MNEKLIRRVVTGGVIVGMFVIFGGLGFALWQSFSDGPRPDVSDLEPNLPPLPDANNGARVLAGLDTALRWGSEPELTDWISGKDWDQEKIDAVLAANKTAFALLDQSLAMPGFRLTQKNPPGTWVLQELASLKILSATNLWKHNQEPAAIGEVFQALELGRCIETGGWGLGDFGVGNGMEIQALDRLCRFACNMPASRRQEIKSLLDRLDRDTDHTAAFCEAMKNELTFIRRGVDELSSGKMRPSRTPDGFPMTWIDWMLFQPNNTIQMFAESTRDVIRDAPLAFDKIDKRPGALKLLDGKSRNALMFSPNGPGRVLFYSHVASLATWKTSWKYRIVTQVGLTRALIAVRLYWLDHGQLPATLSELTPAYVKAVPVDAFDGKQLRYSPAHKVIYSIGADLVDRGGDLTNGNTQENRQPTVEIAW